MGWERRQREFGDDIDNSESNAQLLKHKNLRLTIEKIGQCKLKYEHVRKIVKTKGANLEQAGGHSKGFE